MAYEKCILRLKEAAGRDLTDEEVGMIYGRLHKAALDIKAGRKSEADITLGKRAEEKLGVSGQDDVVRAAAKRAAAELVHEADVRAKRAYMQVLRTAANIDTVGSVMDQLRQLKKNPTWQDAVELLITRNYKGINVESIEQRTAGYYNDFMRELLPTWESFGGDFLGFFQDAAKQELLIRELRGENTGDAMAKRGAAAFHKVSENARVLFNSLGGDMGKLDDWGMPQHHSQVKVASAGGSASPDVNLAAWVKDMMNYIDKSRYVDDLGVQLGDAEIERFLGKAWETISSKGHANTEPGKRGGGSVASRHAEHRQIHFKDAKSMIEYWKQYGESTLIEILAGHVGTMARDIATVEKFGPNPDATFRTIRDIALQRSTVDDPRETVAAEARSASLDRLWNYTSGKATTVERPWLKETADVLRNLNVSAKLGGAAIASLIGDRVMMEAVGHLDNIPLMKRWGVMLSMLNPANAQDRATLMRNGLMLEGIQGGLNRFGEELGQSSFTGKIASAVMRVTGMNAINNIPKGAFSLNLMAAIGGELANGVEFGKLAESDVRMLRNYGITEVEWKIWKQAALEKISMAENVLTPDAIGQIPDAKILAVARDVVAETSARFDAQITELQSRNVEDAERIQKRVDKFNALQDRLNRAMKDYAAGKTDSTNQLLERLGERIDDALGNLSDVRGSTAEGAAAIRQRFDQALADAQKVGKLKQRMAEITRDARDAITSKAEGARDRIELVRDELSAFIKEWGGKGSRADEWVSKRKDKFDAMQDELNRAVKDYAEGKTESAAERINDLGMRAEELLGGLQSNRADAVEVMRASVNSVDEAAKSGKEFGASRERMRNAVIELNRAINSKAGDVSDKIQSVRDSIAEYADAVAARQQRRQFVVDRLTRERDEAVAQIPANLRRDAIIKLLGAVNSESEFAIVTPGWKERSDFYGGVASKRGTAGGELWRAVLQFKSFPYTQLLRMFDAVANEKTPASKAGMTAALIVATTIAGAMLTQVREMLAGKDPRAMADENWMKFWGSAFLSGGALGIYGDFLYSANQTRMGSGPLEVLAGPTIGPLLELAATQPMGALRKRMEGKESHLAAQSVQDIKGFIPGSNIWYLKQALDHMIWQQVLEALNPGYMASIRSKTLKEYGQKWWYEPGEMLPERAPDFGAAVR